jgi:small GTP-binding protein
MLCPEPFEGNVEYKWKLLEMSEIEMEKKKSQLKYRLTEGNGEAIYYIGVRDNGMIQGLDENDFEMTTNHLVIIAKSLHCYIQMLEKIEMKPQTYYAIFLIQEIPSHSSYIDIKIGMIGNVDSGKSTLTGVLTKGCIDNGRGLARSYIFQHEHEKISGRTSSIGHHIVGFNSKGEILQKKKNGKWMKWQEIVEQSEKIITFYDLAGHEKYLKTTIYGLSSFNLDYCIVVIGGAINHMTREHIHVCLSLQIPFIIVLTKIDITPPNIRDETMKKIENMCLNKLKKIPWILKSKQDIHSIIGKENIQPIFEVSNVTMECMEELKYYMSLLFPRKLYINEKQQQFQLQIDGKYSITGFGTVVSGLVKSGNIKVNDTVYLGPNHLGQFIPSKIKSIHIKLKNETELNAGIYGCVCLRNIDKHMIQKGMVLLDESAIKKVVRRFTALIQILNNHSTTIKPNYQPYLHIEHIRQSAKLLHIEKMGNDSDKYILRNGDKAKVHLEFLYKGEYINKNMKLLFRDGLIKASGIIIDIE